MLNDKTKTKPAYVKTMGMEEVPDLSKLVGNQPVYAYDQDKVEADSPYYIKHEGNHLPVFDTVIEAKAYKGGSNDAFPITTDLFSGGRKTFYMPVYMPKGTA